MRVVIRLNRKKAAALNIEQPPLRSATSMGIDLRGVWCHTCGSRYIRLSRQRGTVDHLLSWIGYMPFRCYSCGRRFHFFAPKL